VQQREGVLPGCKAALLFVQQHPREGVVFVVMRLLLAALCIGSLSCSAANRAPMASPGGASPASLSDASVMPGDPRAELDALFAQVEQQRTELALPEAKPESASVGATPMSVTPLSTDATCKPAKTDRCTSSCTLADSICKNANRICELAAQLTGDTAAAGKCSQAKQTCEAAHKRCCGCQ
jgi:hypothetical protein